MHNKTSFSIFAHLVIQNTQNRDSKSTQIKLDELIRAHKGAHNALLGLEERTQEQLNQIREKYEKLAREARADLTHGKTDTKIPTIQGTNYSTQPL